MEDIYFNNLIGQINTCSNTNDLNTVSSYASSKMQTELTAVQDNISKLVPLIVPPTDLVTLLAWAAVITANFTNTYNNLTQQEANLVSQQSTLASAVASRITQLNKPSI